MSSEKQILTYKGKSLVRSGKEIYYGDFNDKYVISLRILSTKKVGELDVATKVYVQLYNTNPELVGNRYEKEHMTNSMYDAMDFAEAWLNKFNK